MHRRFAEKLRKADNRLDVPYSLCSFFFFFFSETDFYFFLKQKEK